MAGIFWVLIGLFHGWSSLPFLTLDGSGHFARLTERRAQVVHGNFATRLHDFLLVGALAINLLGLLFNLISSSVAGVIVSAFAVVALALGIVLRRRARPVVLAAFRERGLEPLQRREASKKRHRRQQQFGVAALTAWLVAETSQFFAEREDIPWLAALAVGAMLFTFVAIGALLWSTAWVYGDETART